MIIWFRFWLEMQVIIPFSFRRNAKCEKNHYHWRIRFEVRPNHHHYDDDYVDDDSIEKFSKVIITPLNQNNKVDELYIFKLCIIFKFIHKM